MKILITEAQFQALVNKNDLGEDYPTGWNIEEFKALKSFSARVKYCNEKLPRISSGSSRIVYKIDEQKALKLAKNRKGLAQNEVEISAGNDYYLDDLVATVYESDPNNLWVEMELARKVTPQIFKNIVGFDFEEYCQALRYYNNEITGGAGRSRFNQQAKPDGMDLMWENEFISRMFDYIGNYTPPVGDLCRLSTYGVVKRNGGDAIVMVDFGLNDEVLNSLYLKTPKV